MTTALATTPLTDTQSGLTGTETAQETERRRFQSLAFQLYYHHDFSQRELAYVLDRGESCAFQHAKAGLATECNGLDSESAVGYRNNRPTFWSKERYESLWKLYCGLKTDAQAICKELQPTEPELRRLLTRLEDSLGAPMEFTTHPDWIKFLLIYSTFKGRGEMQDAFRQFVHLARLEEEEAATAAEEVLPSVIRGLVHEQPNERGTISRLFIRLVHSAVTQPILEGVSRRLHNLADRVKPRG